MLPKKTPWLVILALCIALAACRKRPPAESKVTPPDVRDDSQGLLFTWIDDKGEFHAEDKPESVNEAARETVRVVDPNRDESDLNGHIFVVDLRAKGPDGKYAVRTMTRAEFDGIAFSRRKERGLTMASATPPASVAPPPLGSAAAPQVAVIIYGASWCGACHEAAAYLKKRGISFVEKDVEADPEAGREMQKKLARAGMSGGSIPVIDVRGTVLVGFSAKAIEDAMARHL